MQTSAEEHKTMSTGEFFEADDLEISCDVLRRRLHDGTGGSSATRSYYQRGQPSMYQSPMEYEAVQTSVTSSFQAPSRSDYNSRRSKGQSDIVSSLNGFYSKRNTGNYIPPPSEHDLRMSDYNRARTANSLLPSSYRVDDQTSSI